MEGPHRHAGTVLTLGDQVAALGLLARPDSVRERHHHAVAVQGQRTGRPHAASGRSFRLGSTLRWSLYSHLTAIYL